jgi:hypothetical protein
MRVTMSGKIIVFDFLLKSLLDKSKRILRLIILIVSIRINKTFHNNTGILSHVL